MNECDEEQRTVWCGNLSENITEEILYELFLQAAPLEKVRIPKDKSGKYTNYGFVTFKHVCSVQYAVDLLNGISLYDKRINIKPRVGSYRQNISETSLPMFNVTPLHLLNDASKGMNSFQDINMLMQLGNQLLHNVPTNNFGTSYNQNSSPQNNWRDSGYRNNRREEQRPYRRYNDNNRNDRYNSNRQYNDRRYNH